MGQRTDVTETEMAILEVLWEQAPITVREITSIIYGETTPSLHATVKSLLERLIEKGLVDRDTSSFAHTFSSTVDRARYVGQELEKLVDTHFDGAVAPMLHALVDHAKLKRKDRDAIRQLIENLDSDQEQS